MGGVNRMNQVIDSINTAMKTTRWYLKIENMKIISCFSEWNNPYIHQFPANNSAEKMQSAIP